MGEIRLTVLTRGLTGNPETTPWYLFERKDGLIWSGLSTELSHKRPSEATVDIFTNTGYCG